MQPGRPTNHVFTARVTYGGPDRFDVTRKSGGPKGEPFAPSWGLLRPYLELLQRIGKADPTTDPATWIRLHKERDRLWADYVPAFVREMRTSYRRNRPAWDALLALPRVALVCYCEYGGAYCHRTLLARDILPKLGAVYGGELPEDEQRRGTP